MAQRYQLSGLCYMHAPAMVQHYLLSMNNYKRPMIDLLKLVKNNFSAKMLEKHIFEGSGGSSKEFLEYILEPESVIISTGPSYISQDFDKFGIGLVSNFEVYDDFLDDKTHHHYDKPSGKYLGNHSMVLVGHREENGKKYYLLQNWWKHKQFVEVDEEYIKKSGATIYFVETPQTKIGKEFSKNFGQFFELELIDKPETYPKEMKSI